MTHYSNDEIFNALHIIKDICDTHECLNCPFGTNSDTCQVNQYVPMNWTIADEKDTIWRALEE